MSKTSADACGVESWKFHFLQTQNGLDQIAAYLTEFREKWLKIKKRGYFKRQLQGSLNLYVMCWAPEGYTRPHEHLYPDGYSGAPAAIHVLRGGLVQAHFSILEESGYSLLSVNDYCAGGDPIEEEPGAIHRIGNNSLENWAVSLHEFVPGFRMRVYDFALNKKWIVSGRKDTLGPPPKDAEPIWPT